MVPVSGANGSTEECYFGHKIADWGASLDVDIINGYGPEHITADAIPDGKYRLFVHYYDTHGVITPVRASVSLATFNNSTVTFSSPSDLTHAGDTWDVCYVNYPSGTIEPINTFTPAIRNHASRVYPLKH